MMKNKQRSVRTMAENCKLSKENIIIARFVAQKRKEVKTWKETVKHVKITKKMKKQE